MWMCINDGVIGASGSIRNYSYLVKKVIFPVDIIPLISLFANSFVALFLFIVATAVCLIVGFSCNVLVLIYAIFAAYCFLIAFTRFTSAICTVVPDFSNLLTIMMQLFFWATPIVWDISMLSEHPIISTIIQCMPFTYLVTSFRNSFMSGNIITANNGMFTIIFWVVTFVMFIWGNYIFKKSKKDFADVL